MAVNADWTTLYDQGGLILVLPSKDSNSPHRWIKTGIEFVNGKANISTVASDRWSDWSLCPLSNEGGTSVTVEMEKGEDGSLWVYLIEGVKRVPLREVTWVFEDEDRECWVGAYAARPAKVSDALEVKFAHLVVETT